MSGWQPPQGPQWPAGGPGRPGPEPRGGPPGPYPGPPGPYPGPRGPYPGARPPGQPKKPSGRAPLIIAVVAGVLVLGLVGTMFLIHSLVGSLGSVPDDRPEENQAPTAHPGLENVHGTALGAGPGDTIVAMQAWRSVFETESPGLDFEYDPINSALAREGFIHGDYSFAVSAEPLSDEEYAAVDRCPVLNLPIVAMPVALVAHLPQVAELTLDAETVAGIYLGAITDWDDPRIAALNPDVSLPALSINPVHRSDTGSTTTALAEWLTAAGAWTLAPRTEWPEEIGTGADGNDGVVAELGTAGAVGYLPAAMIPADRTVVLLQHGGATFSPTGPEATYQIDGSPKVPGRTEHDQSRQLDRNIEGAYPVLVVNYLILCGTNPSAVDAETDKGVFGWILSPQGHAVAVEAGGTAPLSEQLYADLAAAIESIS